MGNSFIKKLAFDSDRESTKIIVALFGGIAAGSVLTSLLVSRNKFNLVDRLLARKNSLRLTEDNKLEQGV